MGCNKQPSTFLAVSSELWGVTMPRMTTGMEDEWMMMDLATLCL